MQRTLKEKAAAKYRALKGTLGRKLESMERRVVRLDARITSRAQKGAEQLAEQLDRSAARVRRAAK